MGFRSVYKRHTPFAMSLYEQVIQGSRKIVIDKVGDVLLYTYLYREEGGYDWSGIKSIELHIGGTKIIEWDSNYLCGPHPILSEQVYSRIHTDASSLFLPIPVPSMFPTKSIRYQNIELIINWKFTPFNVRCFSMFAFLADEELPPKTDILIQQVRKVQVVDGIPLKLYGPVKFLVSESIVQPTKMILDGQDVNISDVTVYTHHQSRFGTTQFNDISRYEYSDIGVYNIRTAQRLDNKIYIFSSTSPIIKIFDTQMYFGSHSAYTEYDTGLNDIWSSCTGGGAVYAASIDGRVLCVSSPRLDFRVPHDVYYMFYYEPKSILIMVGRQYISYGGEFGTPTTLFLGNTKSYDGAFQLNDSPDFGDAIIMFSNDGSSGVSVFNLQTLTAQEYPLLSISDVYDQYSSSILVNGRIYITSGFGDVFTRLYQQITQQYVLETNQYYTTLVYDGSRYLYLYGENTVVRFDASVSDRYSMFVPFCLDPQTPQSTGFLNFDSIQNVILKGCGNGYMYAVNYNILRISNGMAGLLYS